MENAWTKRIEELEAEVAKLTAERDADRRREYGYSQQTVDALTVERDKLEAEKDKLRDDLSKDKAILQSLLDREHEERKDLEEEFTGKLKALERENEALTKENMTLQSSRDEWKRIALEGWWYE